MCCKLHGAEAVVAPRKAGTERGQILVSAAECFPEFPVNQQEKQKEEWSGLDCSMRAGNQRVFQVICSVWALLNQDNPDCVKKKKKSIATSKMHESKEPKDENL